MQCVDCVAAGAAATPVRRTVFGGRAADGRPVITLTIIGVCVVAYLLQLVVGRGLTNDLLFYPPLGGVEPWRFLTAAFLHAPSSFLHIALNMYVLYLTGPSLEAALGRVRFAALYLVAAFGGSVGYLLLWNPTLPGTVGASGAVFGLFGALLVLQRRLRLDLRQTLVIVGINAALGFFVPGIAWQAHLGGFVVGAAVGAVMMFAPRPQDARDRAGAVRRTAVQAGGTVLVVAVLVVVSLLWLGARGLLLI